MPKVSVVIPTYNRAHYLREAIDSVLAQTYQDFEIIIIDDGSTDNTSEIISGYIQKYANKIRYYRQKNRNMSATRNKGIEEANGEYVAFLDSDDIWFSEKLALQISTFEKSKNNRTLGLVGSLMIKIDADGHSLGEIKPRQSPGDFFESALVNGSPAPSSFLIKRECLKDIGSFDETIKMLEDLDIYLKILKKYDVVTLNNVLGGYRIHSSNITKNDWQVYPHQIFFAKKWLSLSSSKKSKVILNRKIKKYSILLLKKAVKDLNFPGIFNYSSDYIASTSHLFFLGKDSNKKSRVLFIESGSGFGGSAKCLYLLLRHFNNSSIKPLVLYYHSGPSISAIQKLDIETKKFSFIMAFCQILKTDMVYINNEIYSHFLNIFLCKFLRKPCICHMRGIRTLTKGERIAQTLIKRFVAVSKTCAEHLIRQGIPESKITVIYDGVELPERIENITFDKNRLGVMSRIVQGKGHATLLKAAKILHQKGYNFSVLIFGKDTSADGLTMTKLKQQVNELGLNDYIFFKGWETDTAKAYSEIDIAICPSELEEAFGLALAEAMSFAKPTVASRIGAYAEHIQDRENGLLFKPQDAQDLAEKIELIMQDQTLRDELAKKAFETAKDKFDIKINVAKIGQLINE